MLFAPLVLMTLPLGEPVGLAAPPSAASTSSAAFARRPESPPLPWRLELEGGALWSSRNDLRIPGDTGTRFSLQDLTGTGAWPVGRITFEYDVDDRHGLRLLYAPVRADGTGTLGGPTRFDGVTFSAGSANARYRFDTYRLAYRYRFWASDAWEWKGGLTALVRDASIELRQGALSARNTDFGVVPLLNLSGTWRIAERWTALFDLEAAGAPAGRAIDAALKLGYDVDDRTRVSLGYRTIEGGADNDSVYTFTWVHAAVVSVAWRF